MVYNGFAYRVKRLVQKDLLGGMEERIRKDKKHPGVLLELRKSDAIWDIALFVRYKIISLADLEGFSEDLIEAVKLILSR